MKIVHKETNESYDRWFLATIQMDDMYLDVLDENGYDWNSVEAKGQNAIVLQNTETKKCIVITENQLQSEFIATGDPDHNLVEGDVTETAAKYG